MAESFRRLIVSTLIVSLAFLPPLLSAQGRRGANVIVTTKDGASVSGELIAVKTDSLVLVTPIGKDETVAVANISTVKAPGESHIGTGLLVGFLIGGLAGAIWGHHQGGGDPVDEQMGSAGGIILFGGIGALFGLGAGAAMGGAETIEFDKMDDRKIQKALNGLRGKARIRNGG